MEKALTGLMSWIDARLPLTRTWNTHMGEYYAPKNFNLWYFFGVFSLLVLVNQLLTGIWLTMNYTPSAEEAFASVEYIMRDVDYGWLLRYMHSTGASAFFHRGLSAYVPRADVRLLQKAARTNLDLRHADLRSADGRGFCRLRAAMGTNVLLGRAGHHIAVRRHTRCRGRYRYLDPRRLLAVRDHVESFLCASRCRAAYRVARAGGAHILALHEVGSNNPDGVEIKKNKGADGVPLDGIKFHPYYSVHDVQGIAVFLFFFCGVMFFAPEMGGFFLEFANFEEANGLKTPEHIAPVWYFTPYYSVLRAVPDKFWGFVFFAASVVLPFALPWLDRNPVRSWRYRGWLNRVMLVLFVSSFIILGVLGVKAPTPERTVLAQICTIFYFLFFLAMPWWSRMDRTKPEPERVTMDGGMPLWKSAAALAIIGVLAFLPLKVVGAESAYDCGTIPCDAFEADPTDQPSLQRGAALYASYCMGCHSLQYSRHNRVARDLGIPEDLYKANLVFDPDIKLGSLMSNSMDKGDAKVWFGATPPDLTLISRARQPEWLYTYLRAFYQDDLRPYGVNNRVYPNVGMPHVLMELQGLPACYDEAGNAPAKAEECKQIAVSAAGVMSVGQFDGAMYDLVNFLAYTAEPYKADRLRIGTYVLLFLVVFFIFAWLLNREYWKDVH